MTERVALFQPADLPAQGSSDASLKGVAICPASAAGPEDRRIIVTPSGAQALFPTITDYGVMSNKDKMLDIDQALWSRIVAVRHDFQYEGHNDKGNLFFLYQPICREANPVSGSGASARYRLFARTAPEIYNPPSFAYPAVSFSFQPREIQLIIQGLPKADGSGTLMQPLFPLEYATDLRSPHGFYIQPALDLERVRAIEAAIRDPQSPIAPDRREQMAQAFHQAFGNQFSTQGFQQRTEENTKGMRSEMRWTMIGMAGLQVLATAYALGKGAPITYAFTFLPRTILTPLVEGALNVFTRRPGNYDWRWTRDFFRGAASRLRYRGLGTVLGSGTNLTELARRGEIRPAVDSGTEVMIERIMNRISTPRRAGSAIVEAPPGWGKEVLMRNLALQNQNIVFIQTQPDDLMAGTMYRGQLEEKLKNIPKEIEAALKRGQRVVLCIDEFHEAITAGKSMEETRSLLERWKGPLANGTLRIVGFSTPDEMMKVRYQAGLYESADSRTLLTERQRDLIRQWENDPSKYNIRMSENIRPLLNRFRGFEAPVRTQDDMKAMLNDELSRMREQDKVEVKIEPRTIDMIVRLSESPVKGEGYIPRSAFDLFDGVIADSAETTDMDHPIEIKHDAFENYVKTSWPRVAQRFGMISAPGTPAPTGPLPPAQGGTSASNRFRAERIYDADFHQALLDTDPSGRLAKAYRRISPEANPVRTIGDFLDKAAEQYPHLAADFETTFKKTGSYPWQALLKVTAEVAGEAKATESERRKGALTAARVEAMARDFESRMNGESPGRASSRRVSEGREREREARERAARKKH